MGKSKYLSIPMFALVMSMVIFLTARADERGSWVTDWLTDNSILYYTVLFAAMAAGTVLFGYAAKQLACLLGRLSVKECIFVSLGLFFCCVILAFICLSFIPMLAIVFAMICLLVGIVPLCMLIGGFLRRWKAKDEKSFKLFFTVAGSIILAVFAVLSFAFIRLTYMKANCRGPEDVQYYALVAFSCVLIVVAAGLSLFNLYSKRAWLDIAKRCLIFLLVLGFLVTSMVSLAEYFGIWGGERGYSAFGGIKGLCESVFAIVKMGITGDDVVYVGKGTGGVDVYLAIDRHTAYHFLEEKLNTEYVLFRDQPQFVGLVRCIVRNDY